MAQLGSTQGASLVPDLSQSLNLALQTFGTPETREAKRREEEARQAEVDRQAAIQQQMQNVLPDPTRDPGEQRAAEEAALLRLVTLDPDIAKLTRDTLAKGDESELAALKAEAEKGARNAEFVSSQSDFAAKQRAIGVLAQDAAARGEPLDRLIELQNMNEDRLDLELQKMKLAAQDIETVLTLPKREIIEDVTGVSRFVDTGEAVFPAVVEAGIPEKTAVVQSSKILPGGVVQVVFKDGSIETLEGTPEEIAIIKAAEDRGTSLAVERARQKAGGVVEVKGKAGRVQKTIAEGVDAVQGIPILRRSLQLLERIETGGIDAARLRAKQLFGVEGADEGELSANLGRAVLSQLKATFGSAFTEREGARLERMSAGFGKSAGANKRILRQSLKIADNAAQRALDAARESGDTAAEEQILDFLDGRFDLTDEGLTGIFTPVEELTDAQLLEQLGQQ